MLTKIMLVLFVAGCSSSPPPTSTPKPPTAEKKCVQNQQCVVGFHWDRHACACVADTPTP